MLPWQPGETDRAGKSKGAMRSATLNPAPSTPISARGQPLLAGFANVVGSMRGADQCENEG